MEQTQIYHIRDFVLDLQSGTLHREGFLVPLRPKTYDLLAALVRKAGRVVTKDELFDTVWPRTTVSEDSLTQCIRDLRKVLSDERQQIVRTVPRRGYMLQLPEPFVTDTPIPDLRPSIAGIAGAEPMVAVLPFRLKTADDKTASLFEGVVEEITHALSCFKTIAVLARYSALALAAEPVADMRATAERIGADYLVEGVVDDAGGSVAVRIALGETRAGRRLWSQTFSFQIETIFEFQQMVARRVVTELAANIESAAMRRNPPAPASSVEAYGNLLRGIALLRSYGDGVNQKACDYLQSAIDLDPDSGLAFAYLALAEIIIGGYGSSAAPVLERARDKALHGIALSPDEARCHRILGLVLLYSKDFSASEHHFGHALDLNPYDADTLAQMGFLQAMRGYADTGLTFLDRALQLNPMHPPWYYFDRGEALLCAGRYQDAALCYERLPRKDGRQLSRLSAAYALAGDLDKAASCVKRVRAMEPDLTLESLIADASYERVEDRQMLQRGLRLAGWT